MIASDSRTAEAPLKVLLADDDAIDRRHLQRILAARGYKVVAAADGKEAVQAFETERPDVVLMDVNMPGMSGYDAARLIKKSAGDRFVPLMFVTARGDDAAIEKCIAVGGDDYVAKPASAAEVHVKITALARMSRIYEETRARNQELLAYRRHAEHEQEVARQLYAKIVRSDSLEFPNLRYSLSPVSIFNGDLLLAARAPMGGLNVLVGDFTGHGLAAAIGALPASESFYRMTAKGFSVGDIAREINGKLHALLPTGRFLAACVLALDPQARELSIWCGGMPDVLIVPAVGGEVRSIRSTKLPLGVVGADAFDLSIEHHAVEHQDRVYMYSDGVVEAENERGEMFGVERLCRLLRDPDLETTFSRLSQALDAYRGSGGQQDDVTLVEVTSEPLEACPTKTEPDRDRRRSPMNWRLQLELEGDALRSIDPLPLLAQMATEMQGLEEQRADVYTVLAELYSNALDHGVLGLESGMKSDPSGFAAYYATRQVKLEHLEGGAIRLELSHRPSGQGGGGLAISVTDSGAGFAATPARGPPSDLEIQLHGRGISLVRRLCRSLEYREAGRRAEAVYAWTE